MLQHFGQGHFDAGQFGQRHLSPEPGAAVATLQHPRLAHLGQKHFDQDHFGVALSGATGPTARLEHPRLAHLGQKHFDQDHFGVALSGVTPPPGPSGDVGDTFPLGWKSTFAKATFALGWVNRDVAPAQQAPTGAGSGASRKIYTVNEWLRLLEKPEKVGERLLESVRVKTDNPANDVVNVVDLYSLESQKQDLESFEVLSRRNEAKLADLQKQITEIKRQKFDTELSVLLATYWPELFDGLDQKRLMAALLLLLME